MSNAGDRDDAGNVKLFVPRPREVDGVTYDEMRAMAGDLDPDTDDAEFNRQWCGYVALKQRIEYPRRRGGPSAVRIGRLTLPKGESE